MQTAKGFTLIELMFGAAIIVIVLLGLLVTHTQALQLCEISRNKTIAINAARQELERIRNLPYDDASSTNDVLGQNGVTFTIPPLAGNAGADPGTIILMDDPDYPGDNNIRQIAASVVWTARGNLPGGSVQLITRRCRY